MARRWMSTQPQPHSQHNHTTRLTGLSGREPGAVLRTLTASWPLSIRVAPGNKGLGLFATRRIEAGEVAWEEAPLIALKRQHQDEPQEEEEDEVAAEETTEHKRASQPKVAKQLFCAHCHSLLQPPSVLLSTTPDSTPVPHPDATDVWHHLLQQPSFLTQFALDPARPPLAPSTPCRTSLSSHPGFDATNSPCDETYCSSTCEGASWSTYHHREHMSAGEVKRFTAPEMGNIMAEPQLREMLALLLRLIAAMRSSAASLRRPDPAAPLSLLDHLSHFAAPISLGTFTSADLNALDHSVGPLLSDVLLRHPLLRLTNLPGSGTVEQRLLRVLLAVLETNSFQLVRARPSIVLSSASQSDVVLQYPRFNEALDSPRSPDPSFFTEFAAVFSLASFMNHACAPYNNIGIEAEEERERRVLPVGRMEPTRFAALRTIEEGEELLWKYDDDATLLPARYGFTCNCTACVAKLTTAAEQR